MKVVLFAVTLLLLTACSQGNGRYELASETEGIVLLDTRTGCVWRAPPGRGNWFVQTRVIGLHGDPEKSCQGYLSWIRRSLKDR